MRRRLQRKFRRIRRNFDPVVLGQTKAGFILAVVLVVLWWVGTDARAATILENPGYSENSYFKLEWSYDLTNGSGNFIFHIKDIAGGNPYDNAQINFFGFRTTGTPFSGIQEASGKFTSVFTHPVIDGKNNEQYNYSVGFPETQFHAGSETQIQFNMTFPTNGVALLPTQLRVSGSIPLVLPPGIPQMDFLTIQTIPEPSSIAALFLGAAGAITGLRRKGE